MTSSFDLQHLETPSASFVLLDTFGIVTSLGNTWHILRKKYAWPTPEAIIGRMYPGQSLPPYKSLDDFNTLLKRLIDGTEERYVFTCPQLAHHHKYWIEVHMEPHTSSLTGEIDGVLLRHEDVTERILLRKQLLDKSGLYESLFLHLSEGVIIQSKDGAIETANPAAERILELGVEQMRGITPFDTRWRILDSEGKPLPGERHPAMLALSHGQPIRGSVMGVVKASGDTAWLQVNADPIYDSSHGELTGVLTSFSDITSERQTQRSLHDLQKRLQLALDAANIGIWDWSLDDDRVYWDEHLYTLFGYTSETCVSPQEAWSKGVHPDDRHRIKREISELVKTKSVDTYSDYRVVWPDGSVHYLRTQARVMSNDDGQIMRIVGATREMTDEVIAENRLKRQAYSDTLTGISNRVRLNLFLETAIARANMKSTKLGVVIFDLDHFKNVNDSFGHPMGDALLVAVVDRIACSLPDKSEFARLGGDEFAVVLQDADNEHYVQYVADEIVKNFIEPFYLSEGPVINTNISAGISVYPEHGVNATEILKAADLAMYAAKRFGRNSVMLYEPQMAKALARRLSLEYDLRNAIRSEELELYYQPLIDLQTRRVIGCEALIRWRDNTGKFVPPLEFIPTAEECGLINELGMWVIATSIKQWKLWQTLHTSMKYISVNVSPIQLKSMNFSQDLIALTEIYSIAPNNIQLEITEGTFLQESMMAESQLKTLADFGFRLAIDDFGTGYSSLAYLKRFSVDVIKIDRSFIVDLASSAIDRDIVAAILAMNKTLGFETLVEGVETERQSDIVSQLGCDYAQGYLYGRPTFADEFAELYIKNQ